MAARPKPVPLPEPADPQVREELIPLLDAIARRHPASPASLRSRLRGGDYAYWPSDDAREAARNEVHGLIDEIAARFAPETLEPVIPANDQVLEPELIEDSELPEGMPVWAPTAPSALANAPAEKMLIWATQWVPITAVSFVAIVAVLASQFAGKPNAAPEIVETPQIASVPEIADTVPTTIEARSLVEPVSGKNLPAPAAAPPEAPIISEPQAVESALETISPPIPVASAQPELDLPSPAAEPPAVEPEFIPPPPRKPAARFMAPRIEAGSGIAMVTGLLGEDGLSLSTSAQRLLGTRLNGALDTIGAGDVETIEQGSTALAVSTSASITTQQDIKLDFASDVQPVSEGLVALGDWQVVQRETPLHRGPDAGLASLERSLLAGVQIFSLATYEDAAGIQWTLVAQQGVAIGYVPSATLVDFDEFTGDLGFPYAGQRGYAVTVSVKALIDCQMTSIDSASGSGFRGHLCRDAYGNWVSATLPIPAQFGDAGTRVTASLRPLFQP